MGYWFHSQLQHFGLFELPFSNSLLHFVLINPVLSKLIDERFVQKELNVFSIVVSFVRGGTFVGFLLILSASSNYRLSVTHTTTATRRRRGILLQ